MKDERNRKKGICILCGGSSARVTSKYCSNICQQEFQYQKYIESWKAGEILGLVNTGIVSRHVKRYLRGKYNNKCCVCGWSEINPKLNIIPLVADHIDGDWQNNVEENLRLICPNCDSLSPTYAGLNKGNGRKNRAVSKRTIEAQKLFE